MLTTPTPTEIDENSVAAIFGAAYPGRDQDAISLVDDAIEALQDKDSFVEAVGPDGEGAFASPYHDDDGNRLDGVGLVGGDAWHNPPLEIVAQYGAVSYTHFAAWHLKAAPNTYTADTHPAADGFPIGVFAYSPLASASIDYDDVANLTAIYEGGAWLAEYNYATGETAGSADSGTAASSRTCPRLTAPMRWRFPPPSGTRRQRPAGPCACASAPGWNRPWCWSCVPTTGATASGQWPAPQPDLVEHMRALPQRDQATAVGAAQRTSDGGP